jgi:hypothetical protein
MITCFLKNQAKNDFFFIFFFTILLLENHVPENFQLTNKLTHYRNAQRGLEQLFENY